MTPQLKILTGDCREVLKTLPDASVQMCVTSPPYWGLRDYGHEDQIGQEKTPQEFVETMVQVFREVRRILKPDGVLWLNIGDSYNAHPGQRKTTDKIGPKQETNEGSNGTPSRHVPTLKPKDLVGIPWMTAFALRADGWYLRQDIIWNKPNPMPESVTDRCTKAHEYIFLLSKSERYFYDADAISEPSVAGFNGSTFTNGKTALNGERAGIGQGPRNDGDTRNKRSVWTVPTSPYPEAHFATYPPDLIKPCILAGSRVGDTIVDPFGGSGTSAQVALELGRSAILIELNPSYVPLIEKRTDVTPGLALA